MVLRGCYEFDLRDSVNRTGCGYMNILKPIEKILEECRVETLNSQLTTFNSFKDEYFRRLAAATTRCT